MVKTCKLHSTMADHLMFIPCQPQQSTTIPNLASLFTPKQLAMLQKGGSDKADLKVKKDAKRVNYVVLKMDISSGSVNLSHLNCTQPSVPHIRTLKHRLQSKSLIL